MDTEMRVFWGVMILLAALVGWLIWMAVAQEMSPSFSLHKNEWKCAASHSETTYHAQLVGKTTIMMPSTQTVCDQWVRK